MKFLETAGSCPVNRARVFRQVPSQAILFQSLVSRMWYIKTNILFLKCYSFVIQSDPKRWFSSIPYLFFSGWGGGGVGGKQGVSCPNYENKKVTIYLGVPVKWV